MTKVHVETRINNFIYRKLAMVGKEPERRLDESALRRASGIAYEAHEIPTRHKRVA